MPRPGGDGHASLQDHSQASDDLLERETDQYEALSALLNTKAPEGVGIPLFPRYPLGINLDWTQAVRGLPGAHEPQRFSMEHSGHGASPP